MSRKRVALSVREREIIRHTLCGSKHVACRNHYAMGDDCADAGVMLDLVSRGLMRLGPTITGGMRYYNATEKGARSVGLALVRR